MRNIFTLFLLITFIFGTNPKVKVKFPNRNSVLNVDDVAEIRWSSKRNESDLVSIFYSVDNKHSWNPISVTLDDGSFDWVVPQYNSDSCYIKIQLFGQMIEDISNKPFTINGPFIKLISPINGETFNQKNEVKISWEYFDIEGEIDIYISYNNGKNWDMISTVSVEKKQFLWSIPIDINNQAICKMKIETESGVFDITNNEFSIENNIPKIEIISPEVGGIYSDNKPLIVSWDSHNMNSGYVKLFYSIDSGKNWKRIRSRVKIGIPFQWKMPSIESKNCRIKIEDVNDKSIFHSLRGDFQVSSKPSIALTYPKENEIISSQTPINITWNSIKMDGHSINMYISYNSGSTWKTISMNVENTGSYEWKVPFVEDKIVDISFKIMDASNSEIFSQVKGLILLGVPSIKIINPIASEIFEGDSRLKISWLTNNYSPKELDIYFSQNGDDWEPIQLQVADIGSLFWQKSNIYSEKCRIKISSFENTKEISNISNEFTITNLPSVSIHPFESHKINPSQPITISWDKMNIGDREFNIYVKTTSEMKWELIESATNKGSYVWLPPQSKENLDYQIKVESNSDETIFDISESIPISGSPWIEILSPTHNEHYNIDQPVFIKWNYGNIESLTFDVLYSIDNGQFWIPIMKKISDFSEVNWNNFNFTRNSEVAIRVVVSDNQFVYSDVNPIFIEIPKPVTIEEVVEEVENMELSRIKVVKPDSIKEEVVVVSPLKKEIIEEKQYFNIIAPNGGEKFTSNKTIYVMWDTIYSSKKVNLHYTIDSGENWSLIEKSINNTGQYIWKIPQVDSISRKCKIRIQQSDNVEHFVTSNAFFTIRK